MGLDDPERRSLREQLASGDAAAADEAMSLLLDAPTPGELDPADLVASLAAMQRLGLPGQAAMSETFMVLAQRHLDVSVPVLIAQAGRDPLDSSGKLSASTLYEVLYYAPELGTTDEALLRRAWRGLEATGIAKLMDPVRARAATLPHEHPLRRALTPT